MNDRSALEWLSEARDYALEVQKLASGLSQKTFDDDRRTQFALCFCLIVVGEALNRVPKDVQALAPDIHWVTVIGLRNRLVHSYWLIDTQIILRIAQADISALVSSIDRLVEKIR
ncbi:MAG: DUF86 domain-containing protein [Rhizobiales bacterium]|nr:DUF86 domain-containing protein [Hyphomicrobiales bacterium]